MEQFDLLSEKLNAHDGYIVSCSVDSTRKIAITGSWDKSIKLWDLKSLDCLHHIKDAHKHAVWSIILISGRDEFISCSADKSIKIWDLNKLECKYTFENAHSGNYDVELYKHSEVVTSLAYSDKLNLLISGSLNRSLNFWNLNEKKKQHEIPNAHLACINSLCVINDGKILLSVSEDKSIKSWSLEDYHCIKTWEKAHEMKIWRIVPLHDNERFLTGSWDKSIKLWSLKQDDPLHVFSEAHKDFISEIIVDDTDSFFVSGGWEGLIKTWSLKNLKVLNIFGTRKKIGSITCLGLHSGTLFSGTSDKSLRKWAFIDDNVAEYKLKLAEFESQIKKLEKKIKKERIQHEEAKRNAALEQAASNSKTRNHERISELLATIECCENCKTIRKEFYSERLSRATIRDSPTKARNEDSNSPSKPSPHPFSNNSSAVKKDEISQADTTRTENLWHERYEELLTEYDKVKKEKDSFNSPVKLKTETEDLQATEELEELKKKLTAQQNELLLWKKQSEEIRTNFEQKEQNMIESQKELQEKLKAQESLIEKLKLDHATKIEEFEKNQKDSESILVAKIDELEKSKTHDDAPKNSLANSSDQNEIIVIKKQLEEVKASFEQKEQLFNKSQQELQDKLEAQEKVIETLKLHHEKKIQEIENNQKHYESDILIKVEELEKKNSSLLSELDEAQKKYDEIVEFRQKEEAIRNSIEAPEKNLSLIHSESYKAENSYVTPRFMEIALLPADELIKCLVSFFNTNHILTEEGKDFTSDVLKDFVINSYSKDNKNSEKVIKHEDKLEDHLQDTLQILSGKFDLNFVLFEIHNIGIEIKLFFNIYSKENCKDVFFVKNSLEKKDVVLFNLIAQQSSENTITMFDSDKPDIYFECLKATERERLRKTGALKDH